MLAAEHAANDRNRLLGLGEPPRDATIHATLMRQLKADPDASDRAKTNWLWHRSRRTAARKEIKGETRS